MNNFTLSDLSFIADNYDLDAVNIRDEIRIAGGHATNFSELDDAWTNLNSALSGETWFDTVNHSMEFFKALSATNESISVCPSLDTVTEPNTGVFATIGGVAMTDGRIYCVPYNADGGSRPAVIYNPYTNEWETPTGSFPAGVSYYGACVLTDGRIYMAGAKSVSTTTARIYDPANDTFITPTGSFANTTHPFYAVLMRDGRVFLPPNAAIINRARIYDPSLDTLTALSAAIPIPPGYTGSNSLVGFGTSLLLPSGDIFILGNVIVPDAGSPYIYALIYNTTDGVFTGVTSSALSGTAGSGVGGAILIDDSRIFCGPASISGLIWVYNWVTNSTETLLDDTEWLPDALTSNFGNPKLMPDGRVFMTPSTGVAKIFDPGTNIVSSIPDISYLAVARTCAGAVNSIDGDIICLPGFNANTVDGTHITRYTPKAVGFREVQCLSPFINRK
jgi:hypothetical protein